MPRRKKNYNNPYMRRSVDCSHGQLAAKDDDRLQVDEACSAENGEHLFPLLDNHPFGDETATVTAATLLEKSDTSCADLPSNLLESAEHAEDGLRSQLKRGSSSYSMLLDNADDSWVGHRHHRRHWVRETLRESKIIARYAFPCVSTSILMYLYKLVTVFVVGHMGAKELAASSLAVMYINVFGYSILTGLSTATETLCSNAVTGASNMKDAGLHLQRGIWISLACSIPLGGVWMLCEPLLILAGQEPALCKMVAVYVRYSLIALPAGAVFMNLVRFLQAQGYMKANLYVLVLGLPLEALLQYLLVFHPSTRMGFYGAPLAAAVCDWVILGLLVLYTCFVNGHQAWNGWTSRAFDFEGWAQYFRFGLPGTLMVCAEWWSFELMALVAGWYGEAELAAQTIVLSTSSMTYMVYNGISIANANRIGNLLGAMAPRRARESAHVSLGLAFFSATVIGSVLFLTRNVLSYAYTSEKTVATFVSRVLPVTAIMQVFDSLSCVGGGVLRGSGRQNLGALVNLIAYYLIALPLSILFYWKTDFRLVGMWFSLTLALAITGIMVTVIIRRTDWDYECARARRRVRTRSASMSAHVDYLTSHVEPGTSGEPPTSTAPLLIPEDQFKSRPASDLASKAACSHEGAPLPVKVMPPSSAEGNFTSDEDSPDPLEPDELLHRNCDISVEGSTGAHRTIPVGSFYHSA